MDRDTLRGRQAPLTERCREEPAAALVTLTADGSLGEGRAAGIIDSVTVQRKRLRHGAAERAAAVIWLLACLALATARWWLLPVLLLPLLAVLATFRRGTDLDADGVTVHAVFGSRRLPWEDVAQLRPVGRRAVAVKRDGRAISLPAMTPADLLRLTGGTEASLSDGPGTGGA